jgi:hypothetical protein
MTTQCLHQLASELLPLDRMRMKLNTLSLLIQFVCPLVCLQQLLSPVTSWAASDVLSELIKKSHFWVTVVYSINPNVIGIITKSSPKTPRILNLLIKSILKLRQENFFIFKLGLVVRFQNQIVPRRPSLQVVYAFMTVCYSLHRAPKRLDLFPTKYPFSD